MRFTVQVYKTALAPQFGVTKNLQGPSKNHRRGELQRFFLGQSSLIIWLIPPWSAREKVFCRKKKGTAGHLFSKEAHFSVCPPWRLRVSGIFGRLLLGTSEASGNDTGNHVPWAIFKGVRFAWGGAGGKNPNFQWACRFYREAGFLSQTWAREKLGHELISTSIFKSFRSDNAPLASLTHNRSNLLAAFDDSRFGWTSEAASSIWFYSREYLLPQIPPHARLLDRPPAAKLRPRLTRTGPGPASPRWPRMVRPHRQKGKTVSTAILACGANGPSFGPFAKLIFRPARN